MRIGIDGRLWNETGVGRYIRNLVTHLREVDKKNDYVLFVKNSEKQSLEERIANSKWHIVTADEHWHSFREQVSFPLILYKQKVDLMHFPYFSLPVLYHRPFVITVHDLIIHHFSTGKASTLPLPLYKMKRVGYQTVLRQAVQRAKSIIVPLDATKNDLMKTLHVPEKKIAVTYEGVDALIAKGKGQMANGLKQGKYFLYVGNAYPHKNVPLLIRTFQSFKQKYATENVRLLLVGKDDYFYRQLHEQIKNNRDIHIFHNVPDDVLHELYTNAVAVVAPSVMEGFGLVPLEAMASECLVIASDIPSHQEVCGDAAVYFDPQHPEDLLFALENIYKLSDAAKKKYIQKGKARLHHFSWKAMAQQTVAIYESSAS